MKIKQRQFLTGLLLFWALVGFAQSSAPLVISDNSTYSLDSYLELYKTTDTLSGSDALEAIRNEQLRIIQERGNLGMNDNSTIWALFTILNIEQNTKLFLEVENPQIDSLTLYAVRDDSTAEVIYQTGDRFTFQQRPILHRDFIFPLSVQQNDTNTYLLQVVKRATSVRLPIKVYNQEKFILKGSTEGIVYGIYFGFVALVSLAALFIGILLRRKLFIFYGLYVLSLALWFFSRLGFSYQFITSDYPNLNTHFFPFWTSTSTILLIIYVQSFFQTKSLVPRYHKLMNFFLTFFFVGYLAWFLFPEEYLASAKNLFATRYIILFVTIVFAYISAIKSIRKEKLKSALFLFAYTAFFTGTLMTLAAEYGVISLTEKVLPPMMIGFIVEVSLLSIAMIFIVFKSFKERDLLRSTNQVLNEKVVDLINKVENENKSFLTLNSKAVIALTKIKYIQSDDHYLEFHVIDKSIPEIDRNKISTIKNQLPAEFQQIHRSTIVNLTHIKQISSSTVQLKSGEELPVSRSFKKQLEERLQN